jgi:hypothetical protein
MSVTRLPGPELEKRARTLTGLHFVRVFGGRERR